MGIKIIKILTVSATLSLLIAGSQLTAQTDITNQSMVNVDLILYYTPLDLAFETWDETNVPDTVMWDAYRLASGYLAGIAFHYEKNRDRLSVFEQIDEVATDIAYTGYDTDNSGNYSFNFDLPVPYAAYMSGRGGTQVTGHGVSDIEDLPAARREARSEAFEEAVRSAMRTHYSQPNQIVPGVVDGWITWYDITRDETDPESGSYVFDVDAWVKFKGE
jgi:hypothetical protein